MKRNTSFALNLFASLAPLIAFLVIIGAPTNAFVVLTPTRSPLPFVKPLFESSMDDVGPSDVEQDGTDGLDEIETEAITETMDDIEDLPPPTASSEAKELISILQSLGAIAGRGEFASREQKKEAEEAFMELEFENPTLEPSNSDSMLGRWELVYATTPHLFRSSPFFMAGRAVCKTDAERDQYNWFCDMHRKALAISTIGAVRQIVTADSRLVSEFEVQVGAVPFLNDLTPFSYSGGLPVAVTGALVSSADVTSLEDGQGWELYMDTVEVKGSNIPGLRQLLDSGPIKLESRQLADVLEQTVPEYSTPRPIFRTTYLDDSFRVSRDQDDNCFLYVKTSKDTSLTDYSNVDSDLGIGRLLEGFNDAVAKIYL